MERLQCGTCLKPCIYCYTIAGKDGKDAKPYLGKLVNDALQQLEDKEQEDEST